MRALITSGIVIVLIVAFGIGSHLIIDKPANQLIACIDGLEDVLQQEDWEEVEEQLRSGRDLWQDTSSYWSVIIHHDDLDGIEFSLERLEKYIQAKEKGLSMAEMGNLRLLLKNIIDEQKMTLKNIL